jgi:hypothetical protein
MGWTVEVLFAGGARDLSLLHGVQTGSGAHPASYIMGIEGSFPGDKSGCCVKLTTHLHLMPRSRMVEIYLHFPYVFMTWCLIN